MVTDLDGKADRSKTPDLAATLEEGMPSLEVSIPVMPPRFVQQLQTDVATLEKSQQLLQEQMAQLTANSAAVAQKLKDSVPSTRPATSEDVAEIRHHLERLSVNVAYIEKAAKDNDSVSSLTRPDTGASVWSKGQLGSTSTSLQDKASWKSMGYASINAMPLMGAGLEETLVEKVVARAPDAPALGVSEIMVRDVANSVVREIVGIFDALIDRLLVEKKQDTIRTIVAHLMTEEVSTTISVTADELKRKELGHLMREVEGIRAQLRDSEASWEQRFTVTQDLRDSQVDLWNALSDRCKAIETHVTENEAKTLTIADFEARWKPIKEELQDNKQRAAQALASIEVKDAELTEHMKFSKENYCSKDHLSALEEATRLRADNTDKRHEQSMKELREYTVPVTTHDAMKADHEQVHKTLKSELFQLKQDSDLMNTFLKKTQRANDETFATKNSVAESINTLATEHNKIKQRLTDECENMKETLATNLSLEEFKLEHQNHISALNATLDVVRKNCDGALSRVRDLEEQSASFATRDYAYSTANTVAKQVATDGEVQEQVDHLMKHRDEYRERICQAMRQMQHNRQELNNQADEIHQLRLQKATLQRASEDLKQRVEELQDKKIEESEGLQGVLMSQRHIITDLEASVKKLQKDFESHIETQRGEAERLMERSNKTYLEQIDKALQLENKLTSLERNFKLPSLI